jgi:RNA polymerase primary sigma factor
VRRALATLSEREAQVIRLYFGLDQEHSLTLEEIGEKFNLTRERVRQIKEKAIRRLRHASRSKALRAYLGWRLFLVDTLKESENASPGFFRGFLA